jgi:hypothetical protein
VNDGAPNRKWEVLGRGNRDFHFRGRRHDLRESFPLARASRLGPGDELGASVGGAMQTKTLTRGERDG